MELLLSAVLLAQLQKPIRPNETPPSGRRIEANDGDTIVVRNGARVRVVQRSEAMVRAIFNSQQRWLLLLVDYADPEKGGQPDGMVDTTYHFDSVEGVWPLGERWQGSAVIDGYSMTLGSSSSGVGLTTSAGLVQLLSPLTSWFADDRAAQTLKYGGGGHGNSFGRVTFEQAESRAVADAVKRTEDRAAGRPSFTSYAGPNGPTATSSLSFGVVGGVVGGSVGAPSQPPPPPGAPVRVGGIIKQPKRVADVPAILPPAAAQAGVRGVVIVEIVIDTDGSIKDAKVLRSIPLLDQAALDAVKQWRYEPTHLNGQPVPVIITATVAFQ